MDTRSFILLLPKKSKNILHTNLKQAPQPIMKQKEKLLQNRSFSWKKPDYFNLVSL